FSRFPVATSQRTSMLRSSAAKVFPSPEQNAHSIEEGRSTGSPTGLPSVRFQTWTVLGVKKRSCRFAARTIVPSGLTASTWLFGGGFTSTGLLLAASQRKTCPRGVARGRRGG